MAQPIAAHTTVIRLSQRLPTEPVIWALLRRRIRLRGPVRLLQRFGECFAA